MNISGLLDEARRNLGLGSDLALGRYLGAGKSDVTNWRGCRSFPGMYYQVRLSKVLGLDLEYVVAVIQAEKEGDPDRKAYWEQLKAEGRSEFDEEIASRRDQVREQRNGQGSMDIESVTEWIRGDNQALSAYEFWLMLQELGNDRVKEIYPRSSYYRHLRILREKRFGGLPPGGNVRPW